MNFLLFFFFLSFFFFCCESFFQQYIYFFHWPTYITGFPISWYVPPCSVWYLKNENLCVIRLTLFKCRKMTNLLQGFFMADIIKLWKFLLMLQKNGLFPVNQYLCNIYTTCWALANCSVPCLDEKEVWSKAHDTHRVHSFSLEIDSMSRIFHFNEFWWVGINTFMYHFKWCGFLISTDEFAGWYLL